MFPNLQMLEHLLLQLSLCMWKKEQMREDKLDTNIKNSGNYACIKKHKQK